MVIPRLGRLRVMTMTSVADNLMRVLDVSARTAQGCGRAPPRVVAVSKTKPVSDILAAYDAGHRHFGENYVQEVLEKSPQLPGDIRWHFIGHLQSNKAKALVENVPSLSCVESVDSEKLASRLNSAVEAAGRGHLDVFVQVNTSGEDSKYGVNPPDVLKLCTHVVENCPRLKLKGLMTIGMPDYTSRPENFTTLVHCRDEVSEALRLPRDSLELSMGMSQDFVAAIEMGSTNIRVGSTIFGARTQHEK
jgi:pyridoxal phosphate enzyme (YggS family)